MTYSKPSIERTKLVGQLIVGLSIATT